MSQVWWWSSDRSRVLTQIFSFLVISAEDALQHECFSSLHVNLPALSVHSLTNFALKTSYSGQCKPNRSPCWLLRRFTAQLGKFSGFGSEDTGPGGNGELFRDNLAPSLHPSSNWRVDDFTPAGSPTVICKLKRTSGGQNNRGDYSRPDSAFLQVFIHGSQCGCPAVLVRLYPHIPPCQIDYRLVWSER